MRYNLGDYQNTDKIYDLCIIGTGPAGAVLAQELASTGLAICILESGGPSKSSYCDSLRQVINEGDINIKEYSRERIIGGASSTWSGLSSFLDESDMSERSYLKVPGWPIARSELMPFWNRAVGYGFPGQDAYKIFSGIKDLGQLKPAWNLIAEKVFLATVPPQRFKKYIERVCESDNIDLFFNATVVSLDGAGDKQRVSQASVITSEHKKYSIRSKYFVLATGGIENARILLSSNDICREGLGNENDQVGRYFMNHPKNNYGYIKLREPIYEAPYYLGCMSNGFAGFAGLRLSDHIQGELRVLNSYVRLEPVYPWSDNKGVESFVFVAKKVFWLLKNLSRSGKPVSLKDYSETGDDSPIQNNNKSFRDWIKLTFNIGFNLNSIFQYGLARVFNKRKVAIKTLRLRNFMEMEPDFDNRITLSDRIDANGSMIPSVYCRTTDLDNNSLIKLHSILSKELSGGGIGSLVSALESERIWPINQDASHHLGTTRMGNNPQSSVVDKNCRIHTVDNVFCVGGSVFSTSGCANPTLTICALSIRLADHLKENVFGLGRG